MHNNKNHKKKEIKTPKKITRTRLQNIAVYYLQRYESTTSQLKTVLNRRVYKAARFHDDMDMDEVKSWIDDVTTRMQELGYVDNERYAKNQIRQLFLRGESKRKIFAKLAQKGIDHEMAETLYCDIADKEAEGGDAALLSAARFARRKRFGPYQPDEQKRQDMFKKNMASMARAGFSYDTIRTVLETQTPDELEQRIGAPV